MEIRYTTEMPAIEQFWKIFLSTGWNDEYNLAIDELKQALDSSWTVACAYDGEQLVGIGRVISDRSIHAMIYDLITDPNYREMGIGTHILDMLVGACKQAGIRDIQLFSARGKRAFYEQRGFVARPNEAPGMQYVRTAAKQAPPAAAPMIDIHTIMPEQYEAARRVMESCTLELWGLDLKELMQYDDLEDLLNPCAYYLESGGEFLVIEEAGKVIGTGGLHPIEASTCELKRVWLYKEQRGRGLGKAIAQRLIQTAKRRGYKRIVLEIATLDLQPAAVGLYKQLGFQPIDKYNKDSPSQLAMELILK